MKKIAVGILAHVDSGKTTLSEALMYCTGNISKLGRVDHRDSFLDTFSLERDRRITIFSKQAVMKYNDTEFTLLDTPGHIDFSAETERTLQVLDYAILVISGTDGVQSHTCTLWRLLKRYNVPCFIFVNKMDLEADRLAVMAQLRNSFNENCVDFTYRNTETFKESVALCDDEILDKFYETDEVNKADIIRLVAQRKLFPCFFGSALKLEGVREFIDCFENYTVMPDYSDEFGAKVFKISQDNQNNRLTFLKVTSGSLKVREILKSEKNVNDEKVNCIRVYSGEKFHAVDEATAGTVCAVTGITFAQSGDGLGIETDSEMPMLEPVLTYRVDFDDSVDPHTALAKMKILESEDPQLNVVWNSRLAEIHIQVMGEIQLEVLKSLVFERFGMNVEFSTGSIIYKETIENEVEGVGHFEPLRHYAEVHLLIKPLKRGSGIAINSRCKEDLLDRNWQRLILTHLYEKTHIGVLSGFPITDVEITLVSGKAHAKHTEGGDFRQATYRAVRQGLRSARSILLEPVYEFTLEIPNENVGKAISDIQRMYGSFAPPEVKGEQSVIVGTAPVSKIGSYTKEVMQYTHGKGKLACVLKGYEPCHNSDEVIAKIGYDCDSDLENPCDSVFCSHGAGYNVSWDEVSEYMHLPSILTSANKETKSTDSKNAFAKCNSQDDVFALDKELMQIFEQTYGPITRRKQSYEKRKVKAISAIDKSAEKFIKSRQYNGTEYLLVDGYNVIFAWEHLRELTERTLDGARQVLINILCNYQGYSKCKLILVFDAYRVKGQYREIETVNGISIVYTKEAETADMYIEKVTHTLAKDNRVRVVTSDALEQMIILGNGALRVSSQAFLEEVREAEAEIREIIKTSNNKSL